MKVKVTFYMKSGKKFSFKFKADPGQDIGSISETLRDFIKVDMSFHFAKEGNAGLVSRGPEVEYILVKKVRW